MTRLRVLTLLAPCILLPGCATPVVRAPAPAGGAATTIGAVQGPGMHSPLLDRRVTVEGIVTADLVAGRGGVFVQSARGADDGDEATSDGIFVVRDAAAVPALAAGQRVTVTGTVAELAARDGAAMTALRDATVTVLGTAALPKARALVEVPSVEAIERFEGMRVGVRELTFSGPFDPQRDDAIVSLGGRLFQPTELARPGAAAQAVAADNARLGLRLKGWSAETGRMRGQLPQADLDYFGRAGTRLVGVRGVLEPGAATPVLWLGSYFSNWPGQRPRMRPFAHAKHYVDAADIRDPDSIRDLVSVAAINLENYFNGDGRGGGYPTARGAKDPAAQARQLAKLVHVVRQLRPAVAALMEVENDGSGPDSALAQLVASLNAGNDALNDHPRARSWRLVDTGTGPGSDAIRVAMIYDANVVVPVGAPATLTDGPFASLSRAPLAQAFRPRRGGATLVVVANHFKSKGCRDAAGADADRGDGQSCWNATRLESARRLDAWLKSDPTGTRSALAVILGDLNSYRLEDPVVALTNAGWRDAFEVAKTDRPYDWADDGKGGWRLDADAAKAQRPYSYVWNGQAGRLDHALLSPALAARLTGVVEWHINADEAAALGYANAAANATSNPWRSSDHDPLLLGFDLGRSPPAAARDPR